jgi:hypothetical protein
MDTFVLNFTLLYDFFWAIPRRLNFYMPTFRNTLFHLHRQVSVCSISTHTYLPMKMEQTECSETSAYKNSDTGELPRRNHATFRTWRKFEIKNFILL